MIKLGVSGIAGRMGRMIALLASSDKDFELAGGFEAGNSPHLGKDLGDIVGSGRTGSNVEDGFDKISKNCDVLIDFTFPEVTMQNLKTALKDRVSLVIGTTGCSPAQIEDIKKASKDIPIVFSPNMSIGANILFKLAEEVAGILGKEYEIEIVEAHHNKKKDAPSGTAKRLGESVKNARGAVPPIHAIRAGDIVGDHTVIFAGPSERLELTHRAQSRDVFAKGALAAAKFLINKKPGLYTMHDVIGGRVPKGHTS